MDCVMFSKITLGTCTLRQFVHYGEHMYRTSQGTLLSHVLSLSDPHVLNEILIKSEVTTLLAEKCVAPLDDIIVNHLLCVQALHARDFILAFNHQSAAAIDIVKLLRTQKGTNWMLPVMNVVCCDLRLIAQKADSMSENPGDILEQATDILMACYRLCIGDTGTLPENSKILGLLSPVNQILNIFFKTHRFNLCLVMIKAVEPEVQQVKATLAQQVTFRFYVGRLAVLEGDFIAANNNLIFAFKQCCPVSVRNKQRILLYLLPVKMLFGYMPPLALVEKYDLPLLWELLTTVKNGNIKRFEQIYEDNRNYFVDVGLVIAIENLRLVMIRNVFRKVYLSQKSNKIDVSCFQAGLQLMAQMDVNIARTKILIATMIYTNKMKAYLSYDRNVVHFTGDIAFPRLSSLERDG